MGKGTGIKVNGCAGPRVQAPAVKSTEQHLRLSVGPSGRGLSFESIAVMGLMGWDQGQPTRRSQGQTWDCLLFVCFLFADFPYLLGDWWWWWEGGAKGGVNRAKQ